MIREIPILLVDDDELDRATVQRAFRKNHLRNELLIAENGERALEILRSEGRRLPGLILLDLNMPVMGGLELLRILKCDDTLRAVPVVVLTSSAMESDKVESYDLSVAGYIVKPVDFAKFVDVTRVLDLYWTVCELPDDGRLDARPFARASNP
jgi:CheY-like chemotaxis protein